MVSRPTPLAVFATLLLTTAGLGGAPATPPSATSDPVLATFRREIQPILAKYCFDCHGNGTGKGSVTLDEFTDGPSLRNHDLWLRALKNVRSGIMPPAEEPPLPAAEAEKLMRWIKRDAFGLEAGQPDPGRVIVRRLNRVEYRNTVRDLLGVDFDTQKEFPADDTGYGFDNIGAVLTVSPMLLEKYLDAAQAIIAEAVPMQPRVMAESSISGRIFTTVKVDTTLPPSTSPDPVVAAAPTPAPAAPVVAGRGQGRPRAMAAATPPASRRPAPTVEGDAIALSYYTPATVSTTHHIALAGKYQLTLELRAAERYVEDQFDLNRCRLTFSVDGETVFTQEFMRESGRKLEFPFERELTAGDHTLTVELTPLTTLPQWRNLRMRVNGIGLRGPYAKEHWVKPAGYAKTFPQDPPADLTGRNRYARTLLEKFASRAYRRPVEPATLDRLVAIAESIYTQPKANFEAGVAQAMIAVLASPRFLFREEPAEQVQPGQISAALDEYALASRLSYFLWSTMPDETLLRLAAQGQLRANLPAQLDRMIASDRANEFVRNFTGQWLRGRDVASVPITALDVFLRDHPTPELDAARITQRRLFNKPRDERTPEEQTAMIEARRVIADFEKKPKPDLTEEIRRAMREETELTFAHVLREDRSLLELLESNYTFLNEPLARHYGIEGVNGRNMRKVTLAPDSPRGGVLTQGTVLAVTSNPTRTSPVKRGVFILETILGTPPAPPPPNIPPLEDAAPADKLRQLNLRETLALHAKDPMCASCHMRMDPLGLALENFNAMGVWRTSDGGHPVDPAGKLITGEKFSDVRELKHVLATSRRSDFYYSISEKLLTYALGRGLEYYDTATLDRLVSDLEASGGKPSTLLRGIVTSVPFQQRRSPATPRTVSTPAPAAPSLVSTTP